MAPFNSFSKVSEDNLSVAESASWEPRTMARTFGMTFRPSALAIPENMPDGHDGASKEAKTSQKKSVLVGASRSWVQTTINASGASNQSICHSELVTTVSFDTMSENEMDITQDFNNVFDPDQDPEEKRAVRQNYRSLAKKIEEHQANPNDIKTEDLLEQVRKADRLFSKVKGPQEATLDSHLLLMATNVGAQKARAMKSGSGAFDIDEFVSKLLKFLKDDHLPEDVLSEDSDAEESNDLRTSLDWDRIGRKAMAKSRRVPTMGFMLGPLSIEQKKRPQVQKRAKLERNKEDERRPQELKESDIQRSQNETTKNVAILEAILNETGPINIFKFVVNPNDFAQSVENIFYLSFLIRDGKAAFETQDGEPIIFTCEQPSDKDYEDGLKKHQLVLEFDMATWRRAIEVFKISESLIPQRPPAEANPGNKWRG